MEKEIQRAILDYLHIKHIFAWRNNTGGMLKEGHFYRFGLIGSADILGIMPDGRFLAIEVKAKKGKPTPKQEEFIAVIRKNKGIAFVAHSVDEAINNLAQHGY